MGKARIIIQMLILANNRALRWSLASSVSSVLSLFIRFWNNLSALQMAAVVSTLVLVIGAIVEYWKELKLLPPLLLKLILGKSTPFERCVFKKILLHSLGPILVVLGIAGEVVFEGRTFVVEDREQAQSIKERQQKEQELALDQKEAATAELKLHQWLSRKIVARSAQVVNSPSGESFRRLGKLPKAKAEILYKEGDGEAYLYAGSIVGALKAIGWDVPSAPLKTNINPLGTDAPIIGTYLFAKEGIDTTEFFSLAWEKSRTVQLWNAVEAQGVWEDPALPDNTYRIVVGEWLKSWGP